MEVTREILKKARTYRRLLRRIEQEKAEINKIGGPRLVTELDRLAVEADRIGERVKIAETFINSVEDVYARRIMRAKYLDGLTWRAIAMNVGGGNTADSVRMYVSRYLSHLKIK